MLIQLVRTVAFAVCILMANCAEAIEIEETTYLGREHFVVKTETATYYFDRAGGGFSRLIDRDGLDWIAFDTNPLSKYPDSAAAGYRGIPNAVFVGPDKGAGHPGFDKCKSVVKNNAIETETLSGAWKWRWTFQDDSATFTMIKTDGSNPWWFLYEGPVGGSFDPNRKYWGTDQHPVSRDVPDHRSQKFGKWQTLFVGDSEQSRMLVIHQHQPDDLPETLWYLGSENGGSAESSDGMIVVGFGRASGAKPRMMATNQFTIALVDLQQPGAPSQKAALSTVEKLLPR